MDKLHNIIEDYWKDFINNQSEKEHVFIRDIQYVDEVETKYEKE